jgi:DNA-directed RNA polymerase specialized sigma24 family protein
MGSDNDRKSFLIEKMKKDISTINTSILSTEEMVASYGRLVERTSDSLVNHNTLDVSNVKWFSEEEEKEFFSLYGSVRADFIQSQHLIDPDMMLEDVMRVRTILIYQHMPMVQAWVSKQKRNRSTNRHLLTIEDKQSEGLRVLVNCIDRFDCSKQAKFLGYLFRALDNIILKDVRDNKKRQKDLEMDLVDVSCVKEVTPTLSPALVEVKDIWDGCNGENNTASFLTDFERSIIVHEFGMEFEDLLQDERAKSLNINLATFRKKRKNAIQKIKEAIFSRLNLD